MELISRDEARKRGLKRFFTGIPCIRGHIAQRYVSVGSCVKCGHGYFNKWKANNPEKILTISRATTAKNRARRTAERHANREKRRARERELYARNKDAARERSKKWLAKNPDYGKINQHRRRARKINATGNHTQNDIIRIFKAQNGRCAMPWCRKSLRKEYHIDHIVSLFYGGSNDPNNIQLLCPNCNLRKHTKDPIQFAQENGFFL